MTDPTPFLCLRFAVCTTFAVCGVRVQQAKDAAAADSAKQVGALLSHRGYWAIGVTPSFLACHARACFSSARFTFAPNVFFSVAYVCLCVW